MYCTTPSSGEQSPLRGRSLHRNLPRARLLSHVTTRRYSNLDSAASHIEWERRSVKRGCLAHAATTTSATLKTNTSESDHSLLEPLPLDRFRTSLSEELHRAATFDCRIDLRTFGDQRDNDPFELFQFQNRPNSWTQMPYKFFAQISQHLDIESYRALRLTCHSWSVAVSKARPAFYLPSVVTLLPAEIIEQILIELSPIDFNAARHTCRAWMRTSLESRLSMFMLKRGGWFGTVAADLKAAADHNTYYRRSSIGNDEWFLSKRLATECSLSPGWSGHGVPEAQATSTGLRLTSQIDFSQLGVDNGTSRSAVPLATLCEDLLGAAANVSFTISTCTKYLLAYKSRVIYIYALRRRTPNEGSSLQPYGAHVELLTGIVCPDQVLAVSMDTSCRRYAVAALLRGAVGIVHDLDLVRYSVPWTDNGNAPPWDNRVGMYDRTQGSVFIPPSSKKWSDDPQGSSTLYTKATFGTVYASPRNQTDAFDAAKAVVGVGGSGTGSGDSGHHETHRETPRSSSTFTFGNRNHDPPQMIEATTYHAQAAPPLHAHSPTRGSSFSTYPNLCQFDDPPRSIAICPQRRCIAFGCRRGIELHWTDALTGQDLNRWFPLSAPADHLFFMPTRDEDRGSHSRKLRLISSATPPDLVKSVPLSYSNDNYGDEEGDRPPDYYTAVPLSDGRHLLLILPDTGELCLVKDEPQSFEAEKLTRKFIFVGPPPKTDGDSAVIPHIYTAATELQWGVRVVAAYEDRLWLFTVPPDLFFERRKSGRGSDPFISGEKDYYCHHHNSQSETRRIEGVEIASIANLTNLALDGTTGDLTLWAFSNDATVSIFQLASSGFKAVTQRVAVSDGTIVLTHDANGDAIMTDSANSQEMEEEDVLMTDASGSPRDMDGDVFMTDYDDTDSVPNPLLGDTHLRSSDGPTSLIEDGPSCFVPCFPSCNHTYCKYLLYLDNGAFILDQNSMNYRPPLPSFPRRTSNCLEETGSIAPNFPHSIESRTQPSTLLSNNNAEPEDEGYASEGDEEFEGCRFAIYVPPLSGRWNQDEEAEWLPEYLKESGIGIEDEGLELDVIELCRCNCEIVGN